MSLPIKRYRKAVNKFIVFTLFLSLIKLNIPQAANAESVDQEVLDFVETIFVSKNKAVLEKDLELIDTLYATDTKYGQWAYEYEERKVKYINNWAEKQGIKFVDIIPKIVVRSSKKMELKNVILIYFVIQNINMCMKINPMK